jgi:hypothetical protein
MTKIYSKIAMLVSARIQCEKTGNTEWFNNHTERISEMVSENLPSGSGFDLGTTLDLNLSTADHLVFYTSFHHMYVGMYDGWTEHMVTVTPSLANGFNLRITGRNRNDIKEYIGQLFTETLNQEME